ncbi:MAG: alpha/beta fold hydrolase, partial [Chitinophagaceae bacterium]
VGKNLLTEDQKKKFGQFPQLGKKIKQQIRGSKLVELKDVGHLPHIQSPDLFKKALFSFL